MALRILFLILLVVPLWLGANQLENNSSPYLALHANDPVDWRVWSRQVLDKAKKENKLLFVSVGYFACHWCHVMQRESFSDPGIAKKLNRNFVSVKVDRELNSVLDSRLMTFLQSTTGRGGWPMNIILTPDGYPVVGMTYLPPERFSSVLDLLVENWQKDRKQLQDAAREVDTIIAKQLNAEQLLVKDVEVANLQNAFLQQAMSIADELGGGFGNTTKFPSILQLSAMIKINRIKSDKKVDAFILLTLDKMIYSGLHDVIGHGFYRYTVDPDWQTPHFEKMLYTNAQMAQLYMLAADVYQRQDYRKTALNTLDFMQREMRGKDDAMITSLSAVDNKNIEGGYYLWQLDELEKTLTENELKLAEQAWSITQPVLLEGGVLPISSKISAGSEKTLETARKKLLSIRQKTRILPRDDKRLVSLNGLALAAFADGLSQDQKYLSQGNKISVYLQKLWNGKDLQKALDNHGKSMGQGALSDYAATAYGLLKWSVAANDKVSGETGREILESAWQRFYSDKGWRELETSLLPNPLYKMHLSDSAEPSAETLLVEASILVLQKDKNVSLRQRIKKVLQQASKGMYDDPYYYASLIGSAVEQSMVKRK